MSVCCECCMLSGRGLCDAPVTRAEVSNRLWCVTVCDLETSRMRRPWPPLGCSARGINKKRSDNINFISWNSTIYPKTTIMDHKGSVSCDLNACASVTNNTRPVYTSFHMHSQKLSRSKPSYRKHNTNWLVLSWQYRNAPWQVVQHVHALFLWQTVRKYKIPMTNPLHNPPPLLPNPETLLRP